MIKILEKNPKLSLLIAILIAVIIFFMSSLTFPPSPPSFGSRPILYHFIIFFLFAFFLLIAITKGDKNNFIYIGILIAIVYALSDEFHQLFVPGRACAFSDFLVDSAGILFASFLYILSIKLRKIKEV